MSTHAYHTILKAILGEKSGVPNNTSTISTAMLFSVDNMAIHAHDLLGGAYVQLLLLPMHCIFCTTIKTDDNPLH
jgi:hypothetical protein